MELLRTIDSHPAQNLARNEDQGDFIPDEGWCKMEGGGCFLKIQGLAMYLQVNQEFKNFWFQTGTLGIISRWWDGRGGGVAHFHIPCLGGGVCYFHNSPSRRMFYCFWQHWPWPGEGELTTHSPSPPYRRSKVFRCNRRSSDNLTNPADEEWL